MDSTIFIVTLAMGCWIVIGCLRSISLTAQYAVLNVLCVATVASVFLNFAAETRFATLWLLLVSALGLVLLTCRGLWWLHLCRRFRELNCEIARSCEDLLLLHLEAQRLGLEIESTALEKRQSLFVVSDEATRVAVHAAIENIARGRLCHDRCLSEREAIRTLLESQSVVRHPWWLFSLSPLALGYDRFCALPKQMPRDEQIAQQNWTSALSALQKIPS